MNNELVLASNIDGIVSIVSSVMIVLFIGFFIRSLIKPRKRPPYTDVGKKTIRELMDSDATIEDLVRSIEKVEGKG